MWDLKACRSCLSTTGRLERIGDNLKKIYFSVTGLEVKDVDGYPQYLCALCHNQLKKLVVFRRRSRRAFFVLKEIMIKKKQIKKGDMELVDRKTTNLEPPYSYWQPRTNACFFINATEDTSDPNNPEEYVNEIEMAKKESMKDIPDTDIAESTGILTKYDPPIDKSSALIIDIKPANYKEIELEEQRLEEERLEKLREKEEVINDKDIDTYSDDGNNGNNDEIDPRDIDMEDVFKDLNEPADEDSDGLSDDWDEYIKEKRKLVARNDVKEPKKKIEKTSTRIPADVLKICKALASATLVYLNKNEQIEAYQCLLQSDAFKNAFYKCAPCLSVFKDMESLVAHFKWHATQGSGYLCDICKSAFATESDLLRHTSIYHWYKYRCSVCEKESFTINGLLNCKHGESNAQKMKLDLKLKGKFKKIALKPHEFHLSLQERGYGRMKCEVCGAEYNNIRAYRCHISRHEMGKNHKCDICNSWFLHLGNLVTHLTEWHSFKYKCKACGHYSYNMFSAKHHLRTVHATDSIKCPVCNKTFRYKSNQYHHISKAHRDYMKRHHCAVCGVTQTSELQLYMHQMEAHNHIRINVPDLGLPQYHCGRCNVYFLSANALQVHWLTMGHEEAKEIPSSRACYTCKIIFDDEDTARKHSLTCYMKYFKPQTGSYPRPCCYCEEMLHSCREYKRHFREQHPGLAYRLLSENLLCELCGKSVHSQGMTSHRLAHANEEKGIQCTFCSAKPTSPTKFAMHVIFNHTYKPYHCSQCDVRYQWKYECRDHILKVHAPVTPYSCGECGRRFSHLDFLNEHTVQKHGIDIKKTDKDVFFKRRTGKIIVYPDMKIDGSHIRKDVLINADIELCDYLEKNSTKIDYKDCFLFDTQPQPISVQIKVKKNNNKGKRRKKDHTPKRIKTEIVDGNLIVKLNSEYSENTTAYQLHELADKVKSEHGRKMKVKKEVKEEFEEFEEIVDNNYTDTAVARLVEETNDNELPQALQYIEDDRNFEMSEPYIEDTSHLDKTEVENATVEYNEGNSNLEMTEVEYIEDANVEGPEMQWSTTGDDVEVSQELCVDMGEELDENYQEVESDGKYVMIDGILYKIVPSGEEEI